MGCRIHKNVCIPWFNPRDPWKLSPSASSMTNSQADYTQIYGTHFAIMMLRSQLVREERYPIVVYMQESLGRVNPTIKKLVNWKLLRRKVTVRIRICSGSLLDIFSQISWRWFSMADDLWRAEPSDRSASHGYCWGWECKVKLYWWTNLSGYQSTKCTSGQQRRCTKTYRKNKKTRRIYL